MMSVRVCLDLTPDRVILVMTYIKAIERCQAKIIRGEVPGDRAGDQLLSCILNELEEMFTERP
jgi:hypothetical protein